MPLLPHWVISDLFYFIIRGTERQGKYGLRLTGPKLHVPLSIRDGEMFHFLHDTLESEHITCLTVFFLDLSQNDSRHSSGSPQNAEAYSMLTVGLVGSQVSLFFGMLGHIW